MNGDSGGNDNQGFGQSLGANTDQNNGKRNRVVTVAAVSAGLMGIILFILVVAKRSRSTRHKAAAGLDGNEEYDLQSVTVGEVDDHDSIDLAYGWTDAASVTPPGKFPPPSRTDALQLSAYFGG